MLETHAPGKGLEMSGHIALQSVGVTRNGLQFRFHGLTS